MNIIKPVLAGGKKVAVSVFENEQAGSAAAAQSIAKLIREKNAQGKFAVLGMATGASPIGTYNELVRMHKEDGLSFKKVIIFNLDEYCGLDITSPQSCISFMHQYLFDHIDIEIKNCHIPSGLVNISEQQHYCEQYEKMIEDSGGIDLQLLGIGINGHIGFNEPGSEIHSRTRVLEIAQQTKQAHSAEFGGAQNVPHYGITIGVNTILKAKEIILLAWGNSKAHIIQQAVENDVNKNVPASYLQTHSKVNFYLDIKSAEKLSSSTLIKTQF